MGMVTIFRDKVNGEKDTRNLQKAVDKLADIIEMHYIIADASVIEKDIQRAREHVAKIVDFNNIMYTKQWYKNQKTAGLYTLCDLALSYAGGEYLVCDCIDKAVNKNQMRMIMTAIEAKAKGDILDGLNAKFSDRCRELRFRRVHLDLNN